MAQEMTMRGKVFKAYAEAVIARHGFGSNKMVAEGTPDFIEKATLRAQRLINEARWAEGSISIDDAEAEASIAGGEEGKRIFEELANAETWLVENGWLRKYDWATYRAKYHRSAARYGTSVGITAKGWAVAHKYIDG